MGFSFFNTSKPVLSEDEQFQYAMLNGVARTFALTIPQLPRELAFVVGNAYLLCRVADTIEDEAAIPLATKCDLAKQYIAVVHGQASAQPFVEQFYPLLSDQRPLAEKQLVENLERVITITHSFNSKQKSILERCVTIMVEGMMYFQANSSASGLSSLTHFNSYCYHVAGVVGEMLTDLYCEYNAQMAANREQLLRLAVSFGQGLQMVNILKDIWEDLDRGICWLPRDVFTQSGYNMQQLQNREYTQAFGDGLERMIAIAHTHLQNALKYTQLIPIQEQGLRKFCLWAIGMALLTLRKINKNRHFTYGSQVKIRKSSVFTTIMLTNIIKQNNFLIGSHYKLLSKGLPAPIHATTVCSHDQIREWFNART